MHHPFTLTARRASPFGAFLPPGITLELIGDANDYVGKVFRVAASSSTARRRAVPAEDNVIAGNTLLFGATSGEVYLRGRVGERFAARNSGALTVVEASATTPAST